MGFWALLLLLMLVIAAVPLWPYSRTWGYGPTGALAGALAMLLALYWFGLIAFAWPFAYYE